MSLDKAFQEEKDFSFLDELSTITYCVDEYKSSINDSICIFADGVYIVKENKIGTFYKRLSDSKIPNLVNKIGGDKLELKIPKIPSDMYYQILEFFRFIYNKYQTEVYCRVYYSEAKGFYIAVPPQKMSAGLVEWDDDDDILVNMSKEDILVLQVHSHHNMGGRFSGIDEKDMEYPHGIYMVIGNIFNKQQTTQLKFAYNSETKIDISLEDVFASNSVELNIELFKDWEVNCKKKEFVSSGYTHWNHSYSRHQEYYDNFDREYFGVNHNSQDIKTFDDFVNLSEGVSK